MNYSNARVNITEPFASNRAHFGPIGTVNGEAFDLMVEPLAGGIPESFDAGINDHGFPWIGMRVPTSTCHTGCQMNAATARCEMTTHTSIFGTGNELCHRTIIDLASFTFTFVRSGTTEPMPAFGDFDLSFYDIDGASASASLYEMVAVRGHSWFWSEFSSSTTLQSNFVHRTS